MENEKIFLKEAAALFLKVAAGKKISIEVTEVGTMISENCDSDAVAFTLIAILEKCYVKTEQERKSYEAAKIIAAEIIELESHTSEEEVEKESRRNE